VGGLNLKRRLERLEQLLPPEPPEYADLPVEKWVDELMADFGPDLYGYEEDFYRWLESISLYLRLQLDRRISEARQEPEAPFGTIPALPEEVIERVQEALPPHIERWRRVFAEARPQREAKWRAREEWEMLHGRYGKGQEWVRNWDREREELRRRYEGWEREWKHGYAEWRRTRDELEG
jgi:hypothetical protein